MKQKTISFFVLVLILCAFPQIRIFAHAENAVVFNVIVATVMPANFDNMGKATTSSTLNIINNSAGYVMVNNISIVGVNGWSTVNYDSFNKAKVQPNTKDIAISVNGCKTTGKNTINYIESNFPKIKSNGGTLPINYTIEIPAQTKALAKFNPANIIFTLSWANPVLSNITDYYSYIDDPSCTGGYKVSLNPAFKIALQSNDGNGSSYLGWTPGQPLPNPGIQYENIPVTSIACCFSGMNNIKEIDLSLWDTGNVISMKSLFKGCTNLKKIYMSNLDTAIVTNLSSMFYNCSSLSTLNLNNFNTRNVTDMSYMFYGCSSMKSLDISSFETSNALNSMYMFYNCSKLTTIDLRSFVTYNIPTENSANMFHGCNMVKNAYAGSNTDAKFFNETTSKATNVNFTTQGPKTYYKYVWDNSVSAYKVTLNPDFRAALLANNGAGIKYLSWTPGTSLPNPAVTYDSFPVKSMRGIFYNMPTIKKLSLNSWNTMGITDMSYMFYNCSGLTALDLNTIKTGNVTDMSSMFDGCSNLTSINISNFNTANVINMRAMFHNCASLTYLDLTNFSTENTIDMSFMFCGSSKLVSINIRTLNTSNVITMSSMFCGCTGLTSLELSSFYTANVIYMDNMFNSCTKLTAIDISCFNTSNVTDMSKMFYNCSGLKSLNLESFNMSKFPDKTSMFEGCYKILSAYARTKSDAICFNTSLNKPANVLFIIRSNPIVANITDYYTFDSDASTGGWKLGLNPAFKTSLESNGGRGAAYKEWAPGTPLPNPGAVYSGTNITSMAAMFNGCTSRTLDLTLFDTVNVKAFDGMFMNCYLATVIDVSSLDTTNATNMSFMFYNCASVTSLYMLSFDTTKVKNMSYMFSGCSSIETLSLSNFNTINVMNFSYMFNNCASMTSLTQNFITTSATNMRGMFRFCSSLYSLTLNAFTTTTVTNMNSMFQNCTKLTSLTVASFDTNAVTNMTEMFYGCSQLSMLDLSSFSVATGVSSENMFYPCEKLTRAYAKTETEANFFNTTTNKPTTVDFVVR